MGDVGFDSALTRKLSAFIKLSEDELTVLSELRAKSFRIERGQELAEEGETDPKAFVLQSGWGCSFKIMPDGGRQVIAFPIPGDCVGMHSMLLRKSDLSFSALTDLEVSPVESSRMLEIFHAHPRLAAAFLWTVARDKAMIVEHLASIGRRSAIERTAYFFMELAERLKLVGLGSETHFHCPLNQYVIADALGLSAIHVNRVLRQLRQQNLLTVRAGEDQIDDAEALGQLAGYRGMDPGRTNPG
jgi:CRP-like cAMP-binding protein